MTDQAAIDRIRGIVVSKPAQFWEPVAKQELQWYRQEDGVWLSLRFPRRQLVYLPPRLSHHRRDRRLGASLRLRGGCGVAAVALKGSNRNAEARRAMQGALHKLYHR